MAHAPTYSAKDALYLMLCIDFEGLVLLGDLIFEEHFCYSPDEYKKLNRALNYCLDEEKRKMDQ